MLVAQKPVPQIGRLQLLMLLQDPDDLLFREPDLLHASSARSIYERAPVSTG